MDYMIGLRVSGGGWDDSDTLGVMVKHFPDSFLTGGDRHGVLYIPVRREHAAEDALAATSTLLNALPHAHVDGVDRDLVNVSDIAHRVGVTRQGARKWTTADNFPPPFAWLHSAEMLLWTWPEVVEWLHTHRSLDLASEDEHPSPAEIARIEATVLAEARRRE